MNKRMLVLAGIVALGVAGFAYQWHAIPVENSLAAESSPQAKPAPGVEATVRVAPDSSAGVEARLSAPSIEQANPEFVQWQRENGYRLPPGYERLSIRELEARSAGGDKFASQKLGEIQWADHGNQQEALRWLKKAAAQGSLAALSTASLIMDPDFDGLRFAREKFGEHVQGDRVDAYVWARVAAMRGDPDAIFGLERHSKHFSSAEIAQMEMVAMEQYSVLQEQHRRLTGRPFTNGLPPGREALHDVVLDELANQGNG